MYGTWQKSDCVVACFGSRHNPSMYVEAGEMRADEPIYGRTDKWTKMAKSLTQLVVIEGELMETE